MNRIEESPTGQFLHHLHDTVVLLGGGVEIAKLVERSAAGDITAQDVDRLRDHNIKLVTLTKDKLVNVHKLAIDVR